MLGVDLETRVIAMRLCRVGKGQRNQQQEDD
jgi:hypothetical protein